MCEDVSNLPVGYVFALRRSYQLFPEIVEGLFGNFMEPYLHEPLLVTADNDLLYALGKRTGVKHQVKEGQRIRVPGEQQIREFDIS